MTVREAQMLGKPVVVSSYETASSQIRDGIDGVILPMETDVFARELIQIISDRKRLSGIADYCATHEFGNENAIENIFNLMR